MDLNGSNGKAAPPFMNHPYIKLLCYVSALILFEFLAEVEGVTADDVAKWVTWDWVIFAAQLLAPVALLIRTYTDASFARHVDAKNGNGNGKSTITAT